MEEKDFLNQTIDLQEKDRLFVFSDGITDQFGGPKNRKFSKARLRDLIIESCEKSLKETGTAIDNGFKTWKGSNEQTDDVLIIGVEI